MRRRSSDEHGKPEQSDAVSVDAFGAAVGVYGHATRNELARSLLVSHKTHRSNAWLARPACSDFAVRSFSMQMK
jgi:hypothetical protein